MTNTKAIESLTPRQPGRLGKMLIRMFMKRATVVALTGKRTRYSAYAGR